MYFSLYIVSIIQYNATMPAGPSTTKDSEHDKAQFIHKWKAALSSRIETILPQ